MDTDRADNPTPECREWQGFLAVVIATALFAGIGVVLGLPR